MSHIVPAVLILVFGFAGLVILKALLPLDQTQAGAEGEFHLGPLRFRFLGFGPLAGYIVIVVLFLAGFLLVGD